MNGKGQQFILFDFDGVIVDAPADLPATVDEYFAQ